MECLKCGKKTKDEQVFCPRCLESMEAYPVRPDIHIQLPNRPVADTQKKSGKKRRSLSPEEQVVYLRRRSRRLAVLCVALAAVLCVTAAMLTHLVMHPEDVELGKNYTFIQD